MNSVPGTYKHQVLEILKTLKRLSLLPLTILETQAEQTVEDWCEILWGEVPDWALRSCFKEAYRDKEPNQIFEAAHIVKRWRIKKATFTQPNASCTLCLAYHEDPSAGLCPFHMKEVLPQ